MALEIAFAIPSGFLKRYFPSFELGSQTLLMTVRQVGPLCNLPSLELHVALKTDPPSAFSSLESVLHL